MFSYENNMLKISHIIYVKDFFSKCDQIRRFKQIWSYLLKKSLIENFIFCVVSYDSIQKFRNAGARFQVSGTKVQVSDSRFQVPDAR